MKGYKGCVSGVDKKAAGNFSGKGVAGVSPYEPSGADKKSTHHPARKKLSGKARMNRGY